MKTRCVRDSLSSPLLLTRSTVQAPHISSRRAVCCCVRRMPQFRHIPLCSVSPTILHQKLHVDTVPLMYRMSLSMAFGSLSPESTTFPPGPRADVSCLSNLSPSHTGRGWIPSALLPLPLWHQRSPMLRPLRCVPASTPYM